MTFIDTTTKHSARQEKKFAGTLYIYIGLAVILGMIVAYFFKFSAPMRQSSVDTSSQIYTVRIFDQRTA